MRIKIKSIFPGGKLRLAGKLKLLFTGFNGKLRGIYKKSRTLNSLPWIILICVIFAAAGIFGSVYFKDSEIKQAVQAENPSQNKEKHLAFLLEIYDIIQQNFWKKVPDADLAEFFRLAAEKVSGSPAIMIAKDKTGVEMMLSEKLKNLENDAKKKDFCAQVGDIVLANLPPFGRSRLYSQKLAQDLSNQVNNIDPSANLYADLGVDKNADQKKIETAYNKKTKELEKDKTPEAKEKLAKVNRAYEALKTTERKATYDQSGVEPTVTYKQLDSETFYLKISRFTPTLISEFQAAAKTVNDQPPKLHTLILDLRGNIGGAIDQLPDFLGPFIGQNQYAFEYFHQDQYTPYKTTTGFLPELVRYKRVIVLVDNQTQSSAEVMAGVLKKYNVGIIVGVSTKGWGTIERLFEIKNQIDPNELYAVFMAHTLTLADNNQPIEGKGIEPMVNINAQDWQQTLLNYYNSPGLVQNVKKLLGK